MHNSLYGLFSKQIKNKLNGRKLTRYVPVLGVCIAAASVPALADPSPALDRASISVGAFHAEPTFKAGVDTPYGRVETPERNHSSVTVPRLRADILLFDTQGIAFDYYRYDRSYNLNVSGDATIDGEPVTGSANFNANLKIDQARLSYRWWVGSGNSVFGIGLGGAYYRLDLAGSISGTISTPSQSFSDGASARYTDDTVAPLVELGWRYAFSPNVRMYLDASGVKKNGGRLEGHIYNGNIGVEWFPWQNIGLVADYGISRVKLERDGSRTIADLDVRFRGPSLYVKARF